MASLLSLAAELQLSIVEQLDETSTSFIPGPSEDLLNLSRVCRNLRTLIIPFLLKNITFLNEEKSASSVVAILDSPYAEHVRNVHYIGLKAMPEGENFGGEPIAGPSSDDFPEAVGRVLSSLDKLPNLERVTVQFVCAKTAKEDEEIYRGTYEIGEQLETAAEVLEAEETVAYRTLMERSYRALSRNQPSKIKHLELRKIPAKGCSAWLLDDFQALLQNLSSFTISLRGGDNGAGWQINMVAGYLEFVAALHFHFFRHLSSVKHFSFAATNDGPPGIEGGLNNTALPLHGQHMPQLQSLSLEYVFISEDLSTFITAHRNTLRTIRLDHCYSGWEEEEEMSWGDFLHSITSKDMHNLRNFDIGPSDLEQLEIEQEQNVYARDLAVQAQHAREQFPNRRLFDYKTVDDKYGMIFDNEDTIFERFEDGSDDAAWLELCKVIENNLGNVSDTDRAIGVTL